MGRMRFMGVISTTSFGSSLHPPAQGGRGLFRYVRVLRLGPILKLARGRVVGDLFHGADR
jgi:hypothetical protein